MRTVAEADAIPQAEGNIERAEVAGHARSAGVEEQGTYTKGPPGTWEISSLPIDVREGSPVNKPRLAHVALDGTRANLERTVGTAERRQRSDAG